MRFTAGVAMIDPSFYLPFARGRGRRFRRDRGARQHRLPERVVHDLPVQRRRHARLPREQAVPRTDGRDRGNGRDHRTRGVLHVRAQDADAPPCGVGQGDHVGRGAHGQPPQVRGGIEPVAGRLRHRRASVEGSWPAVRRVHRDRARAVDRRVLRVPRRVLRHHRRSSSTLRRPSRSRSGSVAMPTPTCGGQRESATDGWRPAGHPTR